nr:DnaB-like helicase C-terminal domain-containing protein [Kineosporia rhizophila]
MYSVIDALSAADNSLTQPGGGTPRPVPTGFPLLDGYLAGGLRSGELTLIGGPSGVGKTALVLQIARHAARSGGSAVFLSYQQETAVLLQRLIALEAGERHGLEGATLRQVRDAFLADGQGAGLAERLERVAGGTSALAALADYGERLLLHAPADADVVDIREVVSEARLRTGVPPLVVVDHLQGVSGFGERAGETAAGLRELARETGLPVLAVAVTDPIEDGSVRRRRTGHLRGAASSVSEPDLVLMLNEKVDAVARRHLVYDPRVGEEFGDWLVLTVEKNRSGPTGIGVQLRKRLEQSRFEPEAGVLREELADEPVRDS